MDFMLLHATFSTVSWEYAEAASDTLADAVFGTAYELPVPVLTDFSGGAVTDAQITVEIIPESGTSFTVENYTFTPDQTGTFTVRYTIVSNDESAVKEFALTVKDTTAPVIVFDGEVPKTAEAGDTVVLPAVKITDDRDGVLGYRIWLEFEGERTELGRRMQRYAFCGRRHGRGGRCNGGGAPAEKEEKGESVNSAGKIGSFRNFGGSIILFLGLMNRIPPDILEAASIDGITPVKESRAPIL